MQTAEQILLASVNIDDYGIYEDQLGGFINAMKAYAKQACEEQRLSCHVSYSLSSVNKGQAILNAPLPELK